MTGSREASSSHRKKIECTTPYYLHGFELWSEKQKNYMCVIANCIYVEITKEIAVYIH